MNRYKFCAIKIAGVALIVGLGLLLHSSTSFATDYHVGPGQTYTTLAGVSWYTLKPGDTVYIHYGTYHEKFNVSSLGTQANPIRIIGVPHDNGSLPIIDGQNATTPNTSHFKWQAPTDIQFTGVVFVTPPAVGNILPGWIEIRNLEVKNGYQAYNFTAENGASHAYENFAACVYLRSANHVLIDNCILHDCSQAIYNWTGSGTNDYDGLMQNLTISHNYFYNNGTPSADIMHQTYTEAKRITIEYNRYGPMRAGSQGSQLKDRSAGMIIRYNLMESTSAGWIFDLVEPEGAYDAVQADPLYTQSFVYGNIIINKGMYDPAIVHWNEDHQAGFTGRATRAGAKLLFYNNTFLTVANSSDMSQFNVFNVQQGGWACPGGALPGIIDIRNNIFSALPRTSGATPTILMGYCNPNFNYGVNWINTGWGSNTSRTVTGATNMITGTNPLFVSVASNNLRLSAGSSAINVGGSLAPEVTNNYLGLDLTPNYQYLEHMNAAVRANILDLGAFSYGSTPVIRTPMSPSIRGVSP